MKNAESLANQNRRDAKEKSNSPKDAASLKEYRIVFLVIAANLLLWYFSPSKARASVASIGSIAKEMLMILPPMFLFSGMIDQWVSKEAIERHVGSHSGVKGMVIAMALGTVTVGPLYAGFPLAATLLKKGARISNIVAFLTVKAAASVSLVLVEAKFMGIRFAATRLGLTFAAAILMGLVVERVSVSWADVGTRNVTE